MQILKKFGLVVLVAVVLAAGIYFTGGELLGKSQTASVFGTPKPLPATKTLVHDNGDGTCEIWQYNGRLSPRGQKLWDVILWNGVLNANGGCDPATIANKPGSGYSQMILGLVQEQSVDNGDGTCTVTTKNGIKRKGVALYIFTGFMGSQKVYVGCDLTLSAQKLLFTDTVNTTIKSSVGTSTETMPAGNASGRSN